MYTEKLPSGCLTLLEICPDGSALLVPTSDVFTREELLLGDKTAVMIHGTEYRDNAMDGADRMRCHCPGLLN
ncbi:hypothetical protein A8144_12935 [Mycobacterium leprae 3125609]|nr:hypothetical protein A8144_12935 [Mycobacterium leprae 3125609]OAX70306.1 hypothetical protein A3216_12745 [Mycobacterium leprae 7935681]